VSSRIGALSMLSTHFGWRSSCLQSTLHHWNRTLVIQRA